MLFRSSSGNIDLSKYVNKKRLDKLPKDIVGKKYREMIKEVHETLANLKQHFGGYGGYGFELSGLVWFQGFNDIIKGPFIEQYEENLTNLIKDVREDLGVSDLPVVIGELGMSGPEPDPRYAKKHFRFRGIQEAVAKKPEFAGTVKFVKTSPYVVQDGPGFDGGYHYRGRADTFFKIGEAFGKAALELIKETPQNHAKQVQEAYKNVKERYNF